MSLKNAALLALIGMILLSILVAGGFIRDFSAFLDGVVAVMVLLKSAIQLLACVAVTLFFYVYYKAQA